jgi:transcriptional regulator with XRE-family HTH domain
MCASMSTPPDPRQELAAFLRARRQHLTPQEAGITGGSARRRTPGLRREEVAQLSGVSPTWYTWLEQGREVSASPHALARLADALHLSAAERAYLFELAGRRDPDGPAGGPVAPPGALTAALHTIEAPAYLLDRAWTARGWNAPALELLAGWLGGAEPNLLRYVFLDPGARGFIGEWPERARRLVAEFRADSARRVQDSEIADLVESLTAESGDFARAWSDQAVLGREGGRRGFHHPARGDVTYEQLTLQPTGDGGGWKLVMLIPA